VSYSVSFGIRRLAKDERKLGTVAIVVSALGLVVSFTPSFLVLYLAEGGKRVPLLNETTDCNTRLRA
jgi:hypothetical protein